MMRNSRGGIATIIFIILIILSLALAGGVFYFFYQERVKNVSLQGEIEEIKTKQKLTEEKLSDSKAMIARLETKIKDAESSIERLSDNLEKEKTARQENLAQVEKLKMDLQEQLEARTELETKFTQVRAEAGRALADLKDLGSKKTELEAKVKELEAKVAAVAPQASGVELGKIVVNPEGSQIAPADLKAEAQKSGPDAQKAKAEAAKAKSGAPLEGKVLVVNKDYNFAVISLGNKDGVKVGDVFSIYRKDKLVGDVKVEKVHDSMAAAGFVSSEIKDKVGEGDKVVQK
jgi:hypothetical protein